jgi:PAS domain S-box-containing protein
VHGSGDFYRRIVASSIDGIWVVDSTGRILYANERAGSLLGLPSRRMVGMPVEGFLDAVGSRQFRQHLARLAATGAANIEDVEVQYLRSDGTPVLVLVSESLLRDEHGAVIGIVHRMSPDANRRALLRELQQSRAQLDEAQTIARVGSWELDLVTSKLTWSTQMFCMLGLDPTSFNPTVADFVERIAPEQRDHVAAALRDGSQLSGDLEMDFQLVRADGTLGWFRGLGRSLHGTDGTARTLQGTVQDVTDMKEVELRLRDALMLNGLLEVMATAANRSETLVDALEVTRRHLLEHPDWTRAVAFKVVEEHDLSGLVPLRLHGADGAPVRPLPYEQEIAGRVVTEGPILFEEEERPDTPSIGFALTSKAGVEHVVVITAATPFERHAMLRATVGQVADQLGRVAERERVARDLAAARDAAMEASRLKSEFLAIMSHEIRTPMNGVIGLNQLLLSTDLDVRQRRLVQGIEVAGQSLLALINDILDFSKIEAGELTLEAVDFDLRDVVEQTVTLVSSVADDKGITVSVDLEETVPRRLTGDPTRLGQVLSNLLSNAVKFTEEGAVGVRVRLLELADASAVLQVAVTDTGIGIGADQVERLFEPFRQADASTTRTFGGTGLGLSIARRLVAALDGEIGVRSRPGEGSTFEFTCRFGVATPSKAGDGGELEATQLPADDQRRGHVLLVEDNQINQMVALGMLEALGYSADVADNGEVAIRWAATRHYDAVLMDLRMPVMDGYAASEQIRAAESPTRRVPIIAMTASAVQGELDRCLAAGMDDFLSKPVTSARLNSVLRAWSRNASSSAPVTHEPPPAQLRPAVNPSRIDELLSMGPRAIPLVDRALSNFVSAVPATVSSMRQAVEAREPVTLEKLAHTMRGSALNLGAERLADCCLLIETMAQGGSVDDGRALLEELHGVASATVAALQARAVALTDLRNAS